MTRLRETASKLRAAYVEVERICKIWKKGLPARRTKPRERSASRRLTFFVADSRKKRDVAKTPEEKSEDEERRTGDTSVDWMQADSSRDEQTGFSRRSTRGQRLPGSQFG